MNKSKVVVVMPAYNAAETLLDTYKRIPTDCVGRVILVDDGSIDETVAVAQGLGAQGLGAQGLGAQGLGAQGLGAQGLDLELIVHPHNAGYGANQKTCYMEALRQGAEIIIMLHPDGQYDPNIIPQMIDALCSGQGDFVLGSRFLPPPSALAGGMPRYKYLANRFLTAVENLVMGTTLSECHTGYRAYTRRLLETVPFLRNSNDFVFDTEMIFQAHHFGFSFAEVPVSTRYFNEASSISFWGSLVYGLKTLWVAGRYLLHRVKLWQFDLFKAARRV